MAVGAFPLIKLAALAVRQISKPLANQIKNRAKNSPFFRNYICMPPAQMYHYFEVNVKMKLLGLGKPTNVAKLNESAAIELGAELLGEGIIFLVAVLTLSAEYYRQSKKAAAEAAALEERWAKVEGKIDDLAYVAEKHAVEIRELRRLVYSNESKILKSLKWFTGDNQKSQIDEKPTTNNGEQKQDDGPRHDNDNQDILSGSVEEVLEKIRYK